MSYVARRGACQPERQNPKPEHPKSTTTWLNVFNERKVQRNEARKLENIPCHELGVILCRFFAEIRNKDGQDYQPESLAVMQFSLHRHLKNCVRNYSILRDREFANSRDRNNL